jgi:hypothetical protein
MVETEYLRLLEPELRAAIENGEPDRAASFAKEIARLRRKANRGGGQRPAQASERGAGS